MTDYSERVADRLEIHELLARYARMVDFRQWHLHDDVFSADATADYTGTAGIAGTAREVMTWLDRALAAWPVNMHVLEQHRRRLHVTHRGDAPPATSWARWASARSGARR